MKHDLPRMDRVKLLLAPSRSAEISNGRVATRSIAEALNVSKDITPGLLTCCIILVMHQFGFERMEEALHRSVVIAIGPATHRGAEAGGLHHLAILRRGVLNATI